MKIRMVSLNIENKQMKNTEIGPLTGAIVRIKHKKEDKIMLKYDIDVVNNGVVLLNINCIFQIDDNIESCDIDVLNKAVKELEERIEIIIALACEETGFNYI